MGFDLDGTLYDEFDFIDQAYTEIGTQCGALLRDRQQAIHWMRERWIQKGSSYPRIFDEAFDHFGLDPDQKPRFVNAALQIFRSFNPSLRLPARSRQLLDSVARRYLLFLISDGGPLLQRRKFASLGLAHWFDEERCVFTGELGADAHKPSTAAMDRLSLPCPPRQCVFFGDRDLDAGFANRAGMSFIKVYNVIGG